MVDTKKEPPSNRISINTATAEQLAKSLNGIGMKKAEAIVSYREQYGRFTELEQLQEVSGIGSSFLERNSAKLKL
ncbi:competence protein ComEA helix-hairpin-helix repeat region [Candidatus Regiella insecticola 5.15]|uniref:Competence protein ComEA helix-hairpin-helix repeat region n=1 Tax=Candidatus Regiella insecticola 5.15 TaxID=1005043 RepID=G2GXN9_9ENTR|nr:competence protein ComEA helix-hairpin-helix repeat region [Candidatus Regiella insecticola 5.15]